MMLLLLLLLEFGLRLASKHHCSSASSQTTAWRESVMMLLLLLFEFGLRLASMLLLLLLEFGLRLEASVKTVSSVMRLSPALSLVVGVV